MKLLVRALLIIFSFYWGAFALASSPLSYSGLLQRAVHRKLLKSSPNSREILYLLSHGDLIDHMGLTHMEQVILHLKEPGMTPDFVSNKILRFNKIPGYRGSLEIQHFEKIMFALLNGEEDFIRKMGLSPSTLVYLMNQRDLIFYLKEIPYYAQILQDYTDSLAIAQVQNNELFTMAFMALAVLDKTHSVSAISRTDGSSTFRPATEATNAYFTLILEEISNRLRIQLKVEPDKVSALMNDGDPIQGPVRQARFVEELFKHSTSPESVLYFEFIKIARKMGITKYLDRFQPHVEVTFVNLTDAIQAEAVKKVNDEGLAIEYFRILDQKIAAEENLKRLRNPENGKKVVQAFDKILKIEQKGFDRHITVLVDRVLKRLERIEAIVGTSTGILGIFSFLEPVTTHDKLRVYSVGLLERSRELVTHGFRLRRPGPMQPHIHCRSLLAR